MQNNPPSKTTWYFTFGASEKSSLCTQFCRENNFVYFNSPEISALKTDLNKHAIIEGTVQLFRTAQKIKSEISVILVGSPTNNQQKQLIAQYAKIGKLKNCQTSTYKQFRKILYPNLIFIYGPLPDQNTSLANKLSTITGYHLSPLLTNANQFITNTDKSQNLIINQFFHDPKQLRILDDYFHIKIIHLKYNRVDLPNHGQYFDRQYHMATAFKNKSYYIPINALEHEDNILANIGLKLCPKLIYATANTQSQLQYLQQYSNQTSTLTLNIQQLLQIRAKKYLPQLQSTQSQLTYLSSIFYQDLTHRQIIILNFPSSLEDILLLEKLNRKISIFIDLLNIDTYQFSQNQSIPIYFLQTQRWFKPTQKFPLNQQLKPKINYWLISGSICSGKTTVAKYLATQFSYKLIQFQTYILSVKQKLAGPDDGEQLPIKKIIQHFYQVLSNDLNNIYIIDNLPYEKKDLEDWMNVIGPPHVLHLEVEQNQQIKRSRKKAQSDINAELTEQQQTKAKQSTEKNKNWLDRISQVQPSSTIYKINYNQPEIISEQTINHILKPRIYLISVNQTYLYQNIALKYGLGYLNLTSHQLRECTSLIKSMNKRDIIINNHGQDKIRNASQDIYWIQKNLGEIRFLGLWHQQDKQSLEQLMQLQKPQPPQKTKPPTQGQPGEQKPPQQAPPPPQPADQPQLESTKPKFDIYSFQWTKTGIYKNLTQWFFKSKKNITQMKSTPKQCFEHFSDVLETINTDPNSYIYCYNVSQKQ